MRDLRELRRSFLDLLHEGVAEAEASYELTVSARDFSRNTREAVDDKLAFTAALVRAGEVDAANRLLAEFERDVRTEEAVLLERVNEVKAAQAVRREKLTRMRLARVLTTAVLGSSLLAFSAVGMAFAGWLEDREERAQAIGRSWAAAGDEAGADEVAGKRIRARRHKIRIAGIEVALTAKELKTYRKLTDGAVDSKGLEDFLMHVLPPELVRQVTATIATAERTVSDGSAQVHVVVDPALKKARKKAAAKKQQTEEQSQPKEDSGQEPSPEPSEEPSPGQSPDDGSREKDDSTAPDDDNTILPSPGLDT